MKRYAIIPTGNRAEEYISVYQWCCKNNVTPITICTSEEANLYAKGKKINDRTKNISYWWLLGLEYISEREFESDEDYIVFVLNDDVVLPIGWAESMETEITKEYSGASGKRWGNKDKISGYAFALNGRHDIRPDTDLVWYWTDNAIEFRCREEGGFSIVDGLNVGNKYARSSESMFSEQIAKDKITYINKYGKDTL